MPNETAHVQDDLNPQILCMLEGTFFLKRPNMGTVGEERRLWDESTAEVLIYCFCEK